MDIYANAKLGPAGRFALTEAIASGMTQEGGRGRLLRLAGDCSSLVASASGRGC
jgi:hypothetical protein